MKLYHYTARAVADEIIRGGFRNSDAIPTLGIHPGVWFCDVPTRDTVGDRYADGVFLSVEVADGLAARFLVAGSPGEIVGRWREFCIPARIVNRLPMERLEADSGCHTPRPWLPHTPNPT